MNEGGLIMKKILKLGVFLLLLSVFVGCSDFMYAYKTVANDVKGKPVATSEQFLVNIKLKKLK